MFDDVRARFFPAELVPGIAAIAVDSATFWQTLKTIPDSENPFSSLTALGNYAIPQERIPQTHRLNDAYARTHTEHILFTNHEQQCVGWSTGAMIDPSTFFMSYSGVIRSYQRRGVYTAFLGAFLPYLHALGYERVTSHHMVNNRPVLIAKLKAGFIVTGTILDERWGAQVSLAYFFYEDRRQGFARAYSLEQYGGTPEYFNS